MSRLQGETVYVVTYGPDSRDEWGALIPGKETRTPINGCVIVPEGRRVEIEDNHFFAIENIVILTPELVEVEEQTNLEVRGESWMVANPTFDHISPFGTGRGGTEIHARRSVTT